MRRIGGSARTMSQRYAGAGQAAVEDGDDAPVGRAADEAPGRLGQQRGGPRQVDQRGRRRRRLARGGPASSGSSGRGNGMPVDGDEAERGAGHVDALEQPGRGEQAARLVAGEGGQQLGLRQLVLGEHAERAARGARPRPPLSSPASW